MSRIMIHTCPARIEYVENYLIPSLVQQGVKNDRIIVYNDKNHDGNLKSTLKSYELLPQRGSCWHLQDDILISSDFKKSIKWFDDNSNAGVICGFCSSSYDKPLKGTVNVSDMWYSFQCIRIPNYYARGFIKWIHKQLEENNSKYWLQITNNMFDDSLFKSYMIEKHPNDYVYNCDPNLVENIDYLIGGSTLSQRKEQVKGYYFKEPELVKELKKRLI